MHKKSLSARRQPELFPFPNNFLTHSPAHSIPETTISSTCYSKAPIKSTKTLIKHLTMTVPTSCCGRSGQSCVCASKAKCSCGKQSALHCNCEKAKTENVVAGARCSCRKQPPIPLPVTQNPCVHIGYSFTKTTMCIY